MKLFYGWVIVGVGIVITCVGFGAMLTLSIFLQPMASAMGWSRTGIATAALLNFLGMGLGAFLWGALSDRLGTRTVVVCGGVLLGLGLVLASQATTLVQFQLLFGAVVGLATGSFYAPLISTTTRWFTERRSLAVALVSAGLSVGSTVMAPLARWLITNFDWRTGMMIIGDLVWLVVIPAALLVRNPPTAARGEGRMAAARTAGGVAEPGADRAVAQKAPGPRSGDYRWPNVRPERRSAHASSRVALPARHRRSDPHRLRPRRGISGPRPVSLPWPRLRGRCRTVSLTVTRWSRTAGFAILGSPSMTTCCRRPRPHPGAQDVARAGRPRQSAVPGSD